MSCGSDFAFPEAGETGLAKLLQGAGDEAGIKVAMLHFATLLGCFRRDFFPDACKTFRNFHLVRAARMPPRADIGIKKSINVDRTEFVLAG
jgi:hypothetical protein